MDASGRPPGGKTLLEVAVGIEAGILGGLLMIGCVILLSPLIGEPWWLTLNLIASTLYGDSQRHGPGLPTIAGAAMHLVICGAIGALNGLVSPGGRLFGLALTAGWYLFCYLFLWKRFAPMLLAHGSQPILIAGYFLFGSTLGQQSNLLARARS